MIKVERKEGLCKLTLNRPDKANALTREMLITLCQAVETAQQDKESVLLLTAEGKVFSAGADLEAAKADLATDPVWERLSAAVADFNGLSIAALNGTLAGGAFGMVLACDIRIAVPSAKFFYPVMKLGYLPQPSDPKRLSTLVGPARAKVILMAGQKIAADEAKMWGLVDQVAPAEALEETALSLAADVMAASREHAAAIKALIR